MAELREYEGKRGRSWRRSGDAFGGDELQKPSLDADKSEYTYQPNDAIRFSGIPWGSSHSKFPIHDTSQLKYHHFDVRAV